MPESRPRPELLEDRSPAANKGGIVTVGQRARLVVRTAELMPGGGRRREVGGDLEGERLGQIIGRDVPVAGPPEQPGELTPLPTIASREDQVAHGQRLL